MKSISLRSLMSADPGEEPCLLRVIMAAPARTGLDDAPVARPTGNPFFRHVPMAPPFEALMVRIGNSLSMLLLAQSQMVQPGMAGVALGDTNNAALQAFGLMSKELGRLLANLVVMRCQVWLEQAPVSDDCSQTLRSLPGRQLLGQLYGPEAERALEGCRQSSQAPPKQAPERSRRAMGGQIFRVAPGPLGGALPRCLGIYNHIPRLEAAVPPLAPISIGGQGLVAGNSATSDVSGNVQGPGSHPGTGVDGAGRRAF
ncbi:hypothetical protein XENOCAPTIV_011662 [Xenoophorus captivus]|uniref:Uncharacterized protein n=1 Tax=Xenoophorus captivus TaxID=1517983 RepID=A0ABV0Q9I9_9TELE